jgi:hypothetical protein
MEFSNCMYDDPINARVINLILIFFLLICFRTNARHGVCGALRLSHNTSIVQLPLVMISAIAGFMFSKYFERTIIFVVIKFIHCVVFRHNDYPLIVIVVVVSVHVIIRLDLVVAVVVVDDSRFSTLLGIVVIVVVTIVVVVVVVTIVVVVRISFFVVLFLLLTTGKLVVLVIRTATSANVGRSNAAFGRR